MDFQTTLFAITIVATAVLSRAPFLRFPMDDDFAIYTYIARFAEKKLRWKKDLFLVGLPIWRMLLLDKLYETPERGVLRIRLLFMGAHAVASLVIFYAAFSLTHNSLAAFIGGLLYAFYGSSIDYTAGNYSPEQRYIPLVFAGLALLLKGPAMTPYAGLLFGLAAGLFWKPGVFPAVLMWVVWLQYGFAHMLVFTACAALPVLAALAIDWKLGYLDGEARKQYAARAASSLRLVRTKRMYFSVLREILRLAGHTLPVWPVGVPAVFISFYGEHGIWFASFSATILALIFIQRGFSRYHYQPLIALLSLATGLGVDAAIRAGNPVSTLALGALALAAAGNLIYVLPFYLRPMDVKNLSRHEKFDQYIYLPRLGRILNRLIRMRGETDRRIFVWGTFTQLYHLAGVPAADTYLHHCVGPWDSQILEPYFDSVIGGLIRHQPVYLIKAFHDLDVDRLEQITGLKYQLIKVALVRFPVYRLVSSRPPASDPLALPWREKMRVMQSLTEKEKEPPQNKTDCEGKHIPGINKTDLKSGRLRTALKECRKLCKLNPYDTRGLFLLGKLYDWAVRIDESAAAFERLLKLIPNHPHARMIMAKQKINQNNLEEAEKLIQEDVRLFGDREEAWFYLGQIRQRRNQHQHAIAYFERICDSIPELVDVRFHLAQSQVQLGQKDRAKATYAKAFDLAIDQRDAELSRARAALEIARLDADRSQSYETLKRYRSQDPKNPILAYLEALVLAREEETGETHSHFNAALSAFEQRHWPVYEILYLAESLHEIGLEKGAREAYGHILGLAGKHPDGEWLYAKCATALAKMDSDRCAEPETLERYLRRDPKNEILAYAWASALEREGRRQKARSLFEEFASTFRQNHLRANSLFRLARLSEGDRRERFARECLELAPFHDGAKKLLRELAEKTELA